MKKISLKLKNGWLMLKTDMKTGLLKLNHTTGILTGAILIGFALFTGNAIAGPMLNGAGSTFAYPFYTKLHRIARLKYFL